MKTNPVVDKSYTKMLMAVLSILTLSITLSFLSGAFVYKHICNMAQNFEASQEVLSKKGLSSDDVFYGFNSCSVDHFKVDHFKLVLYSPVLIIGIYISVLYLVWNFLRMTSKVIIASLLAAGLFTLIVSLAHVLFRFIPTIVDPMLFFGVPFDYINTKMVPSMTYVEWFHIMASGVRLFMLLMLAFSISINVFFVNVLRSIRENKKFTNVTLAVLLICTILSALGYLIFFITNHSILGVSWWIFIVSNVIFWGAMLIYKKYLSNRSKLGKIFWLLIAWVSSVVASYTIIIGYGSFIFIAYLFATCHFVFHWNC